MKEWIALSLLAGSSSLDFIMKIQGKDGKYSVNRLMLDCLMGMSILELVADLLLRL